MTRTKRKPGNRAQEDSLAKLGSTSTINALERAFSKKFTIYHNDLKESNDTPDYEKVKVPQYKEDFEHIFSKIGFVGFLRKLKFLNRNLNLTLDIAVTKWKEIVEAKHAEWKCDDISDAQKSDMLAQALLSANEENSEISRAMSTKKRKDKASKRAKRKAKQQGGAGSRPTLTRNSGVRKNTRRSRDVEGEVVVQKDPIASRLRSKIAAPDLPPLEHDALIRGTTVPVPSAGADVEMEL
ncbi:hypothetical protein IFR04_000559 [Cadophora malorum]|uniref:Uncharacterized protein n=1 Tax=Cadophora malorum TaxID=108018 RepID=A0A8H7WKI7_9HELO|nr:hypothetical protein IFR04_000559 [Cadophora malorum]